VRSSRRRAQAVGRPDRDLRAGIFPENTASIALHESAGFELVGTTKRIGQMPDGQWRDVVLYERRSALVGAD
jgi:phosphinothricin acetyltransferase